MENILVIFWSTYIKLYNYNIKEINISYIEKENSLVKKLATNKIIKKYISKEILVLFNYLKIQKLLCQ